MSGRAQPLMRVDEWLQAPAPAERLAGLRIAIGGFVTLYLAANVREFARLDNRPVVEFEPIGFARLLDQPIPAPALWIGFAGLMVLGIAFTLGVAYRAVGPAFALGVLAWTSYHSSWGQLLHFEHLFTLHLLILALAPAADAWRIGQSAPPSADVRYGWPIRLLALATAATYVLSGIAKLRHTGFAWFDPDTLATHIGYSATRMETIGGPTPPLAEVVLDNSWLIGPMAIAALAIELGAPVALVGGRARNVWVVAALGFHAATAATMLVFFGYRGLGIGLLPLFAVERVPDRLRSFSRRRRAAWSR
ncbi:MAG: HTTM domain-containing protein [Actinomycetota bacterium]